MENLFTAVMCSKTSLSPLFRNTNALKMLVEQETQHVPSLHTTQEANPRNESLDHKLNNDTMKKKHRRVKEDAYVDLCACERSVFLFFFLLIFKTLYSD